MSTTEKPARGLPGTPDPATYYIASIKHTGREHEHITWWGKDHRGYTPVVGDYIGEYSLDEARTLNDGRDVLAVPVEFVRTLLSPEPYFRPHQPTRFYDQRGPVVDNSRENWAALVAGALEGSAYKPRPQVFRKKRMAFALEAAVGPLRQEESEHQADSVQSPTA